MKKILYIIAMLFALASCTTKEPVGILGDIGLSQEVIIAPKEGISLNVSTKEEFWWLEAPVVGSQYEQVEEKGKILSLKGDWISIKRISKNEFNISIKKNNTSHKRTERFRISSGTYSGILAITQE